MNTILKILLVIAILMTAGTIFSVIPMIFWFSQTKSSLEMEVLLLLFLQTVPTIFAWFIFVYLKKRNRRIQMDISQI